MVLRDAEAERSARRTAPLAGLLWYALALAACLSVVAINGRPLFYFDTIGYIVQGRAALDKAGLVAKTPEGAGPAGEATPLPDAAAPEPGVSAAATGAAAVAATGAATGAEVAPPASATGAQTVDGSRSITYSVIVGLFSAARALDLLVLFHTAVVIAAMWLAARVARRALAPGLDLPPLVGLPIAVAGLGSLPFITGFLMPDIFAPVMILMIAALAVFVRDMRLWEVAFALLLGGLSIVAHLSHLAIAMLLLPAAFVVAFTFRKGRPFVAAALVALIVGAGFAQQAVIRFAASHVANSAVVIRPFITARLIQDGPGLRYLETHCPDNGGPTCLLYAELQKSDDPWRLTASHIIFQTTRQLGSFRFLSEDDQRRVARDQVAFFRRVLTDQPVATTYAFLRNTVVQAGMFDVSMSLPTDSMVRQHVGVDAMLSGPFAQGRLVPDGAWLGPLTVAQGVLYTLSLGTIIAVLFGFGRVPPQMRAFAVLLVLGVLANAFVCGGISQPAMRYGARVIWLLPLAAVLVLMFRGQMEERS